jgi:hypothetical protein
MAIVPLPERGQPIDVAYLYELASAINTLSSRISDSDYRYTSVDTPAAGTINIKTADASIVAGIASIPSFSETQATSTKPFTYNWGNNKFKYPPVVNATPVNRTSGGAGDQTSVVITQVTASGISGIVRFNASGSNISVDVHILAVGIPN